jgi:hypothetical protein
VLRGDPRFEKLVEESKKPVAVDQEFAVAAGVSPAFPLTQPQKTLLFIPRVC